MADLLRWPCPATAAHTDKTYPFLHYHFPSTVSSPYTVRCLRGCLASSFTNAANTPACSKAATQYDYSVSLDGRGRGQDSS